MSHPRHANPPAGQPVSIAPFNFVPLPQKIFEVASLVPVSTGTPKAEFKLTPDARFAFSSNEKSKGMWECHDRYIPNTNSGWIDLSIEALTPIFIRGAGRYRNGRWDNSGNTRLRSEPFLDHAGRPIIPGSSLRGAIRNLVEILSFSKIEPVSRKQPFFRSVAADRVGITYRNLVVKNGNKPRGGFLVQNDGEWQIEPADEILRVPHLLLERHGLSYRQHPNYRPNWKLQHQTCWFRRDDKGRVVKLELREPDEGTWTEGTLVLSGSAPKKIAEFLFVGRNPHAAITVSDELVSRFHDDDQITSWQEQAFPRDEPPKSERRYNGWLRENEPVFFVCDEADDKQLLFMGRAQMFRFPSDESPESLVPKSLRTGGLDLAEAMFGRVPQNKSDGSAIKGRVFFEDCVVTEPGEWLGEEIVPQILAAPKVTAYQEYLTQNGTESSGNHTTYIKGDSTTIRGHKLYWHRWDTEQSVLQIRHHDNEAKLRELRSSNSNDTQCTVIRPVETHSKTGQKTTFIGRIRFENLSDIELGALLSALHLPDECAHKIGMAKPLGLGSIRITPTLHLINREQRYQSWEDSGVEAANRSEFEKAFVDAMLEHAKRADETLIDQQQGLRQIARLDALFQLLNWDGRPSREDTRYMKIEGGDPQRFKADRNGKVNEFRERPVLPTPHRVRGQAEPQWKGTLPKAAPAPVLQDSRAKRPSSNEGRMYRATSEPPRAVAVEPPKPTGKMGKLKVAAEFTGLSKKKSGFGKVKLTETQQELECSGINFGLQLQPGESITVEVDFDNNVGKSAKFVRRGS